MAEGRYHGFGGSPMQVDLRDLAMEHEGMSRREANDYIRDAGIGSKHDAIKFALDHGWFSNGEEAREYIRYP